MIFCRKYWSDASCNSIRILRMLCKLDHVAFASCKTFYEEEIWKEIDENVRGTLTETFFTDLVLFVKRVQFCCQASLMIVAKRKELNLEKDIALIIAKMTYETRYSRIWNRCVYID